MAVLLLVIILAVPFMVALSERREKRRLLAAPGDLEARRIALQAVRLLDRALADPMVRQSTQWEGQAKALVDGYYGRELKT